MARVGFSKCNIFNYICTSRIDLRVIWAEHFAGPHKILRAINPRACLISTPVPQSNSPSLILSTLFKTIMNSLSCHATLTVSIKVVQNHFSNDCNISACIFELETVAEMGQRY